MTIGGEVRSSSIVHWTPFICLPWLPLLMLDRLPCRVLVNLKGVEAFFFNRTPAYDAIVERMKKQNAEEAKAKARDNSRSVPSSSSFSSSSGSRESAEGLRKRHASGYQQDNSSHGVHLDSQGTFLLVLALFVKLITGYPPAPPAASPSSAPSVNWFREALPIDINIETGSVVLGSDASPMVLIGDFKRADTTLHVTDVSGYVALTADCVSLARRMTCTRC